ncbi:Hint domain-containing protein, partial [Cognatishimia sp. F0-27]|uniref:Hint domain-containing protein n=1 Tax=Cognatishimia sp. F0-27 TaxID=2816855 RepID=UPI001D0C67B3
MADYDFGEGGNYIFDTGSNQYLLQSQTSISSTLTDQDGGSSNFEQNEPLFFDVGGAPVGVGNFFGSINIGGVEYPVVNPGGGELVIYISGSDASILPPSFFSTDIDIDPFPVCFAAGTLIAAPDGERAVETLAIGDPILATDGRTVPVRWIGRQTLHKIFTPADRFVPVRVTQGALGDGLPHTDLVLTADHALIIDGLAINAGALVNGTTITYDPMDSLPDRVTYYHVETEDHDVILANGAPAETYVDYVQRRVFDNYQEYVDLYGEERTIAEM